jgi:flagellar hook protein FlgE
MFDIITQAKDAIETYNDALKVTSANIANMNVIGYKRLDASFQSIFEKILRQGTAASTFENIGGTNPQQFGQGIALANVGVDFSAGDLTSGSDIDLAIIGRGLFVVSPDNGESYRYTRAGQFSIVNGNLVTETGMQVYGLNSSGSLVPITGLTGSDSDYSWNSNGELLYLGTASGFRIALTYFNNQQGLVQAEGTTFKETMSSGSPVAYLAPGGAAGNINPGQLEKSNVFYLEESINSTELQSSINACLSVAKMASDLITQFINRLG